MFGAVLVCGCEETNIPLATEAGLEALKAVTLTDREVAYLAAGAAKESDRKNRVAGAGDPYAQRLKRLVGDKLLAEGINFTYKVYLSSTINAFAMADGTIRIYAGLMDMMNDEELLFVVGHEMGHITQKHIKKKIMLAYAASAVRKGLASQGNEMGQIARSAVGGIVQALLNAQFSQAEERQADDVGIWFLKQHGFDVNAAVSALKKLETLGNDHSFLSSHPAPGARAARLKEQVDNPEAIGAPSLIEKLLAWIRAFISNLLK